MERLEQRIQEWAKWYTHHRPYVERSGDPDQYAKFLCAAIDGLLELNAEAALRIQKLERNGAPQLILPKGVRLHENMRVEE